MLDIRIDTRRLNAAMQEFAREARKDLDSVVRQQAGIIVGHLIAMTPPGASKGQAMTDSGGIDLSAKKRGEARIAADIAALFPTTKLKDEKVFGLIDAGFEWGTGRGKKTIREFAQTEADLERIHKFSRSPASGRVRTGSTGQLMAVTRANIRRAYTRRAIKNVGLLAAGWLHAAAELKTAARATPVWITRHGKKPGGVSIIRTTEGLGITVYNRMPYFPKDMDVRIQRAVFRRTEGLRKALAAMIERRSSKANAKMGN
jgi:hypothetical protein